VLCQDGGDGQANRSNDDHPHSRLNGSHPPASSSPADASPAVSVSAVRTRASGRRRRRDGFSSIPLHDDAEDNRAASPDSPSAAHASASEDAEHEERDVEQGTTQEQRSLRSFDLPSSSSSSSSSSSAAAPVRAAHADGVAVSVSVASPSSAASAVPDPVDCAADPAAAHRLAAPSDLQSARVVSSLWPLHRGRPDLAALLDRVQADMDANEWDRAGAAGSPSGPAPAPHSFSVPVESSGDGIIAGRSSPRSVLVLSCGPERLVEDCEAEAERRHFHFAHEQFEY